MPSRSTIAAISTPPGAAGIGIVRVSGPRAREILAALFRPVGGDGALPPPRVLTLGWIVDAAGARVDQALAVFMPAPTTYTREDVIELHCHGGHVVLSRVLSLALAAGCRLAGPGEFTRRAFENGRIDLAQAEAVLDVIRAGSEAALSVSETALAGGLSERIRVLRNALADVLARVEAHIDFPEDDLGEFPIEEARAALARTLGGIRTLAATYDRGRLLRQGVRTVLAGAPNVGKSSLLNRLLARDRAIVTPFPGTTRDALEEFFEIGGVPFHVADVAGYRETDDPVEREGVRIAAERIARADLVLFLLDGGREPNAEDEALAAHLSRMTPPRTLFPVINKSDLATPGRIADLADWLRAHVQPGPPDAAVVSALTGEGLDGLRERLRAAALSGELPGPGEVIVSRLRHREALDAAAAAVEEALSDLSTGATLDLLAVPLREALNHLGEIVGAVTTGDLLDRIFSEFCIGK